MSMPYIAIQHNEQRVIKPGSHGTTQLRSTASVSNKESTGSGKVANRQKLGSIPAVSIVRLGLIWQQAGITPSTIEDHLWTRGPGNTAIIPFRYCSKYTASEPRKLEIPTNPQNTTGCVGIGLYVSLDVQIGSS